MILWGRFHPFDPAPMSIVCGVRLGRKCPLDTFVYRTRKFEYPPGLIRNHPVDGFGAGAAASEENQRHRPPWTAGFWESKSLPGKCEETILKDGLFAFYSVKAFCSGRFHPFELTRRKYFSDSLPCVRYCPPDSVVCAGKRFSVACGLAEDLQPMSISLRACGFGESVHRTLSSLDTFVYRTRKFEYPPGLIRNHQVVVSGQVPRRVKITRGTALLGPQGPGKVSRRQVNRAKRLS